METNENTGNVSHKKENINNREVDLINGSKIIQFPYEEVLSIINKAILFIKNASHNQQKLLDDLSWVIKIITSRTLYVYKIGEEEKAAKNGKRNSVFSKYLKFVTKYHDEIIEMNQNNIFKHDLNDGKSDNILLSSSIKLKKPPAENIRNSVRKKDKIFIKNDKIENYEDFKNNKNNNNNLQIINGYILNNENNENNFKENNNKFNNYIIKNKIYNANINNQNKLSKLNNSLNDNVKAHLIEMHKKSPSNPKLTKEELKYFLDIKNVMKDYYISTFTQNNPKVNSYSKNPKNFNPKISETIYQHNRNTKLPQIAKKYFSPNSDNSANFKNDIKNYSKNINFSGDYYNNIKPSKKLYKINNNLSIENPNSKNDLREKDINKSVSNEKNFELNKNENTSTKEEKIMNTKKNKEEDKMIISGEIISDNIMNVKPQKKKSFLGEKKSKNARLLSKLNNTENINNKSIQEETTQIIPFKSLIDKYQDQIKNIMDRNFNIFELKKIVGYNKVMPIMGTVILKNFGLVDDNIISVKKLENFLNSLNNKYLETTLYHNSIHGTDVTQTLSTYFLDSNIEEICQTKVLDLLGVFISALGHDVGHPGLTNNYHINACTELALNYNDISCLENFHASLLFRILREDKNNIFEKIDTQNYKPLRKRIISQILATDMANHGKVMSLIKSKIDLYQLENEGIDDIKKKTKFVLLSGNEKTKFDEQQSLLDYLIHAADLAHNTKIFNISLKWVQLLSEEYWLQGDKEKQEHLPISFLCDRKKFDIPNSQVGFIKGFVVTTFDCLVTMFPSLKYTTENAENNIKEWSNLIDLKRYKGWTPKNSSKNLNKEEEKDC